MGRIGAVKASPPQPPSIQVLGRAFALIEALASRREPQSLKALSERTGLPASTAHRILSDLAGCGLLDRPQPGSWCLGLRLLELGNLVKARLDVRAAALGPMRELHQLTAQAVSLSIRQGDEIVYVERIYGEQSGMQVVHAIGSRAPLHLTAVGKLFLARDEPAALRGYAERTALAGRTPASLTQLAVLEHELLQVRRSVLARDDEELEPGVRCRAAGIVDDQAQLVAGLSISAPADRMREDWDAPLAAAAVRVSAALGHRN